MHYTFKDNKTQRNRSCLKVINLQKNRKNWEYQIVVIEESTTLLCMCAYYLLFKYLLFEWNEIDIKVYICHLNSGLYLPCFGHTKYTLCIFLNVTLNLIFLREILKNLNPLS